MTTSVYSSRLIRRVVSGLLDLSLKTLIYDANLKFMMLTFVHDANLKFMNSATFLDVVCHQTGFIVFFDIYHSP